jgi:hypothetical protein
MTAEPLAHIDGCHFYSWAYRDDRGTVWVDFAERDGENLMLHARSSDAGDESCERCDALRRGATPRYLKRALDDGLPDDPKESFLVLVGTIGEMDEAAA